MARIWIQPLLFDIDLVGLYPTTQKKIIPKMVFIQKPTLSLQQKIISVSYPTPPTIKKINTNQQNIKEKLNHIKLQLLQLKKQMI